MTIFYKGLENKTLLSKDKKTYALDFRILCTNPKEEAKKIDSEIKEAIRKMDNSVYEEEHLHIPFPTLFADGEVIELELTGFMKAGQCIYDAVFGGDIDTGVLIEDATLSNELDEFDDEIYIAKVRVDKNSDTYKHYLERKKKEKEEEHHKKKQKYEEEHQDALDIEL